MPVSTNHTHHNSLHHISSQRILLNRTKANNHRLLALSITVALCITALSGCSSPFGMHNANNGVASNGSDTVVDNLEVDTTAKKFLSCLTSKGFDAQVTAPIGMPDANGKAKQPTVKNLVVLRMIDANGQPVESGDGGTSVSTDDTTQQMYMNSMLTAIENGTVYVAFKDSTTLTGSPYESKRQDYADCEAQVPSFAQPVQDIASNAPTYSEEDKQAALDYAKKAREKGFSWVADPTGSEPTNILIPKTVREEELRRFFKECPVGDAHISFGFDGTPEEFGYDYLKVMDEATGVSQYSY